MHDHPIVASIHRRVLALGLVAPQTNPHQDGAWWDHGPDSRVGHPDHETEQERWTQYREVVGGEQEGSGQKPIEKPIMIDATDTAAVPPPDGQRSGRMERPAPHGTGLPLRA